MTPRSLLEVRLVGLEAEAEEIRRRLAEMPKEGELDGGLLTVRDAAALLKVSEVDLRRMVARGDVPAVRAGRRIRIRRVDLEHYVSSHRSARAS